MLEYLPAKTEQYGTFLQLTQDQASGYLEGTLELMNITWEEYSHLFRTIGQVYGIYTDGQAAGFFLFGKTAQDFDHPPGAGKSCHPADAPLQPA